MDTKWFRDKIAEQGSQTEFAKSICGLNGRPLAQSAVSRTLSGEREMQISEVRQYARALRVSPVEILIRAGILTEREVRDWMRAQAEE